jgi:hypothetical protein
MIRPVFGSLLGVIEMKNFDGWNSLSKKHFLQIVRRASFRRQIFPIWAVTWRPGDRNGNFLGGLYRPLGSATMMCQVSLPRSDSREAIGLFGITARVEPATAAVAYDEVRLYHDFHRVPFPGARGKILDPSEDGMGRGNASWIRLALDVDRLRERAQGGRYLLPATPRLPQIFLGYGSRESVKFRESDELRKRAAELLDVSWTGNALNDLFSRKAEIAEARIQAFAGLSANAQKELMQTAWDASLVPPSALGNNTGLWLLPQELATNVYGAVRVFEFFGDLVGAEVFNPARRLTGKVVINPAADLATARGFDLIADLEAIANVTDGTPEFQAVEQRLFDLVPAVRKAAGVSHLIGDQDLLNAICQPEQPLAVEPLLDGLTEQQQIDLFRRTMPEHISHATLDCDILEAIRNPHGPLFSAGMCRVQVLHRSIRVPLREALFFSASSLGRDRVEATFWHDSLLRSLSRQREAALQFAVAA